MSYFVTGATGFIGRHLVERLLEQRDGDIHVLVRQGSVDKLDALRDGWSRFGDTSRVKPVFGDLSAARLGVDDDVKAALKGDVEHFFHLAAIYDMTADEERNAQLNVGGTEHAVALADELEAGTLHHVSSIAAAGMYKGLFTEDMFDEGQKLTHPYHRTKFESERIARTQHGRQVARVPALDRDRPLADRRDGQGRRSVLLLQGDPEGPPRAARVGAVARHRGRLDERGAGRLRRRGAGPHRAPAGARRTRVPPRRSRRGCARATR